MKEQILPPGVKDAEKANFSAKMFGIGGYCAQRFCRRLEENVVDFFLVLKCNGGNLFRHSKDDVKIVTIKQFRLPVLYPLCARQALTFWAMSIAAAVERIVFVATAVALFDMTAKSSGPAHLDCTHDSPLSG
jgi:hypothetical protein